MSANFLWHVFLSHSSHDKERVHRLAEKLRDAGLRVWCVVDAVSELGINIVSLESDHLRAAFPAASSPFSVCVATTSSIRELV